MTYHSSLPMMTYAYVQKSWTMKFMKQDQQCQFQSHILALLVDMYGLTIHKYVLFYFSFRI